MVIYALIITGLFLAIIVPGLLFFSHFSMRRRHDSQPKLYQFRKCRLLRDGKIIRDDLWIRDGKIIDPRKIFWEEQVKADVKIDCNNLIICPGFIDLQINGKFGCEGSVYIYDLCC